MANHRRVDESWVRQAVLAVHRLRPLMCPTGLREHESGQLASCGHPAFVVMSAGQNGDVAAVERIGVCDGSLSSGYLPRSASLLTWFCDVPPVADPNAVVTVYPLWDDRPRSATLRGPELRLATQALARQFPPLPAGWVRVPVAGIGEVAFVTASTPVPFIRYVVAALRTTFADYLQSGIADRTRLCEADGQLVRAALTAFGCPSGSVLGPAFGPRIKPKLFPPDQRLVDAGRRAVFSRL